MDNRFTFIFINYSLLIFFNTIDMAHFMNSRPTTAIRSKWRRVFRNSFERLFTSIDNSSSELIPPPRLLQIAQPLLEMSKIQSKQWNSVADIGADHGMLACYLALNRFTAVHAIDRSELSLVQCKQNVAMRGLGEIVQVHLGDGFIPLLLSGSTVDVAIMAGTSATTMASVLSGVQIDAGQNAFLDLNNDASIISAIESNLKQLQVKCVVLQPWPAELMHFLQLSSLLDVCGWKIIKQEVGASNPHSFQLTSFYQPKNDSLNGKDTESSSASCADIFRTMPMVKSMQNHQAINEYQRNIWIKYLKKQHRELSRRVLKTDKFIDLSQQHYQHLLKNIAESINCAPSTKECINVILAIEDLSLEVQ